MIGLLDLPPPVGPHRGEGPTRRMRYVGPVARLKGKTALVMESAGHPDSDFVVAQFDDIGTGYGYGWWLFRRDAFVRRSKPAKGWRRHVRRLKAGGLAPRREAC